MEQVLSRSKLVVFLIDHDEDVRVTHETILRTEGYEILSASDGLRALQQLREQSPDLLIIGHRTGSITPLQLIRTVRIDAAVSGIPIIACLSDRDATMSGDLVRAGADAVVLSHAAPQELIRQVIGLIGRS